MRAAVCLLAVTAALLITAQDTQADGELSSRQVALFSLLSGTMSRSYR